MQFWLFSVSLLGLVTLRQSDGQTLLTMAPSTQVLQGKDAKVSMCHQHEQMGRTEGLE